MNKILNIIKNLTLEKINKNLLFIALILLIYRMGNFFDTFIPKPFELTLFVVLFLTVFYLIKNRKIKEFFLSIPTNIWIALICLMFSVFMGWAVALFFKKIPFSLNAVLEFGTFGISLVAFVLFLFYTKNDSISFKKYIYALLLPTIYIIFIILQLILQDWSWISNITINGLTTNSNIFSKTLLVPAMFFTVYSMFEEKNKISKIIYIIVSSGLFAVLLWTGSRGAILSFFLGVVFSYVVFLSHKFSWKKFFINGFIVLIILSLGFLMSYKYVHKSFLNRVLNPESVELIKMSLKGESISKIALDQKIIFNQKNFVDLDDKNVVIPETRFLIWPFYLKKIVANPLGLGPNTHHDFENYFVNRYGLLLNNGPHNTYLQICLWGGFLGLFSFLYILWRAFLNLKNNLKIYFDRTGIVLLISLFALSVSIAFDDSLSCYWFFIVLALSLRYGYTNITPIPPQS